MALDVRRAVADRLKVAIEDVDVETMAGSVMFRIVVNADPHKISEDELGLYLVEGFRDGSLQERLPAIPIKVVNKLDSYTGEDFFWTEWLDFDDPAGDGDSELVFDRAGHNYIGHNYIGHNYTGHDYIGHNCIGP